MKKRDLIKPIEAYLKSQGYTKVNTLCYSILSRDESVKFIVRMPDMTLGFIIGAQFNDYGEFNGEMKCAPVKNFEFELLLHFASVYDYTENKIIDAVKEVCERVAQYVEKGRAAIADSIDSWAFGELSEREKNEILKCVGLSPIDPYSDEYLKNKLDDLKLNNGSFSIPFDEYYLHKNFYDKFAESGCRIIVDEKNARVMIMG